MRHCPCGAISAQWDPEKGVWLSAPTEVKDACSLAPRALLRTLALAHGGLRRQRAQIPRVVKVALIKDPNAVRAQLLQWAEIESLKRILVSHGSPIEESPHQTLRELARSLEAGTTARQRTESRPAPHHTG